jgi:CheY-like chemotaxis protein
MPLPSLPEGGVEIMKTVLIADDDENIRAILEEVLKREGYRTVFAVNGQEAVEKVREESPDLLILDIRMPGMHGIEALEAVRRENKTLPIIMCSGLEKLKEDFAVVSSDISAFLTKPVDIEELKVKVKEILGE